MQTVGTGSRHSGQGATGLIVKRRSLTYAAKNSRGVSSSDIRSRMAWPMDPAIRGWRSSVLLVMATWLRSSPGTAFVDRFWSQLSISRLASVEEK